MTPILGELFDEIATAGWLVSNLYQPDAGLWRVNLRRPVESEGPASANFSGYFATDWAEATTLAEALETVIAKLAQAEFIEEHPASYSIDRNPKLSLLAQLGLAKPQEPIKRRI